VRILPITQGELERLRNSFLDRRWKEMISRKGREPGSGVLFDMNASGNILLEIQSVTKRFGGLVAINGLSLEIKKGEILGLIGPNGAGKTTLFNLITGFYPVDDGEIFFENERITRLKPYECCRKGIGRTFQKDKTFENRDVLYNVKIGALPKSESVKHSHEKALEILSFVGLIDKREQSGGSLTIPDRKRLEIAKALATDPKLLLLDEVIAGLNPREVDEAIELIRRIREKGIAIFIIEHVMQALMSLSDRVIILHYGQKIGEGTPEIVSKDKKVIDAYLGEEYSPRQEV
jgi:branched-chain amino acid transport system ATP-binding protein